MYNSRDLANRPHDRDESPVRPEKIPNTKQVDKTDEDQFAAATPKLQHINDPDQGLNSYNRVGQIITMQSIALHIFIEPDTAPSTGIIQDDVIRVRLIYDKRADNNPSFNDIYKGYEDNGDTITNSESFMNPDNTNRFEELASWSLVMGYNSSVSGSMVSNGPGVGIIDTVIDLRGRKARWSGSSGSSTQLIYGGLWLVHSCLHAIAPNDWQLHYVSRLTFTDN